MSCTSHSTMLWLLVNTFRNNTIVTVFWICTGKYYSKSKYRPSLRGRCNDQKQYCQYRSEQVFIIVFIAKDLKIRKGDDTFQWLHFVMDSVCQGTSHCNGCVAFKKAVCKYFLNKNVCFRFCFLCSSLFVNKTTSFLTTGYNRKYRPFVNL